MPFLVAGAPQLGDVLRGLRKARKLTQVDVARASGMLQKTVSMLEINPSRCSVDSLMRYIAAVDGRVLLDLDSDEGAKLAGSHW